MYDDSVVIGTQARGDNGRTPISSEQMANAAEVVIEVLRWKLSPARWGAVEQILSVLQRALDENDADMLTETLAHLELMGPIR
jgi:hypothetical protein